MATISEQYSEVTLSLQASRNTIRNKLVELGLAANADTLDKLAAAIAGIIDRGAVSIKVKEGETVEIPAGWHNGGGTVSGVTGGGNYNLQSKTITPTKKAADCYSRCRILRSGFCHYQCNSGCVPGC